MRLVVVLFISLMTLVFSTNTLADCIQSPERTTACPHQLYRLGQLENMPKPAMLCICVVDFKEFLTIPADPELAHKQKLKRLKLEYALGRKIEPILQVLRN